MLLAVAISGLCRIQHLRDFCCMGFEAVHIGWDFHVASTCMATFYCSMSCAIYVSNLKVDSNDFFIFF